MNNFIELNNSDLCSINAGVSYIDIAISVAGIFCPPIGVLGAIITISDWLDEQPW